MSQKIVIDSKIFNKLGELFEKEDSPYPAQITVVDKENGEIYMVRGYVSLDTLENMIKSAITPKSP